MVTESTYPQPKSKARTVVVLALLLLALTVVYFPRFFLPLLGRAAFVVSQCLGSNACSLGGRLLALMISPIVCFTDTSGSPDAITVVSVFAIVSFWEEE
jgi:hypothetical protein